MRELFWATTAAVTITAPIWIPAAAHAQTPSQHLNVCYALRHGERVIDIENALIAAGYTPSDGGSLAGRMIRDHCPDQIDNVEQQVGYE